MIEAASKKIPVIGSHVEPYLNSPMIQINQQGDWYKEIKKVTQDAIYRQEKGLELFEWAVANFSLFKVNEKRKQLYQSLSVPISRLEPDGQFSLGRSNEITRDEVKFSRFIGRLRHRFTMLFDHLMEIQLALKGVMSREEWREMRSYIKYDFQKDNYFSELKDQEVLTSRLQLLNTISPYINQFYTKEWVQKNVLRFTDEQIEEMESEMQEASADQMDQAIQTKKSEPEQMPDTPEQKNESSNKPLSDEEKMLIESMTKAVEILNEGDPIDITKIGIYDAEDTLNTSNRSRG